LSREDGESKPAATKNGAEDGKTIIDKETAKVCSDEEAAIKKNLLKEATVAKANLDEGAAENAGPGAVMAEELAAVRFEIGKLSTAKASPKINI
jgi:hypothetical protein